MMSLQTVREICDLTSGEPARQARVEKLLSLKCELCMATRILAGVYIYILVGCVESSKARCCRRMKSCDTDMKYLSQAYQVY